MQAKDKFKLQQRINKLNNELCILMCKQANLNKAAYVKEVETPLEDLYKELGLMFVDGIKKTLQEARNFHRQIIINRADFLQDEKNRIDLEVKEIEEELNYLNKQMDEGESKSC